MSRQRFQAEVRMGHKGPAIVLPFDPMVICGEQTRYFVAGTLNGCPFEGEIGFRRRVFYSVLPDDLLDAAGLVPGDTAEVVMEPRTPTPDELKEVPKLASSRLVQRPPKKKRAEKKS